MTREPDIYLSGQHCQQVDLASLAEVTDAQWYELKVLLQAGGTREDQRDRVRAAKMDWLMRLVAPSSGFWDPA